MSVNLFILRGGLNPMMPELTSFHDALWHIHLAREQNQDRYWDRDRDLWINCAEMPLGGCLYKVLPLDRTGLTVQDKPVLPFCFLIHSLWADWATTRREHLGLNHLQKEFAFHFAFTLREVTFSPRYRLYFFFCNGALRSILKIYILTFTECHHQIFRATFWKQR